MKNLLAPHVILDLTDKGGAFCTKMLGDLGADVIKIEKIGIATEDHIDRMAFNTGKRSITLDIESVEGRAIFLDLVGRSDFVIESFPPGYLQKLGLGYSDLSEVNPAVIMTSITPFGQTGPHKDLKATDLICNAMGGLVFIIGDEDRPPVLVGSDQAYFHGGAQAAVGSMIAHHWRRKKRFGATRRCFHPGSGHVDALLSHRLRLCRRNSVSPGRQLSVASGRHALQARLSL